MIKIDNSAQAKTWLSTFSHPLLPDDWAFDRVAVTLNKASIASGGAQLSLTLPFVTNTLADEIMTWAKRQGVLVDVASQTAALKTTHQRQIQGVKNIIAVSSGKGGVGKSTTSVNLALALQALGARVGVLDADIYGPSIPLMLGTLDAHPETLDGKMMQPVMAHHLATNSIGYLIDDADAAVWRGPMASKALMQLLNETAWNDLDYLVVDLPPGTGDIQLTLAQQIPVTAAVVVTTPQDLALADVTKGVAMFDKVNVPVVGIVENMSVHVCSKCGHEESIFGVGGAEKLAVEKGLSLLAQLPLHINIREDIDRGCPTVVAAPKSALSLQYRQLAEVITAKLFWHGETVLSPIHVQQL